jgi:hypothetical protein
VPGGAQSPGVPCGAPEFPNGRGAMSFARAPDLYR